VNSADEMNSPRAVVTPKAPVRVISRRPACADASDPTEGAVTGSVGGTRSCARRRRGGCPLERVRVPRVVAGGDAGGRAEMMMFATNSSAAISVRYDPIVAIRFNAGSGAAVGVGERAARHPEQSHEEHRHERHVEADEGRTRSRSFRAARRASSRTLSATSSTLRASSANRLPPAIV